MYVSRASPGAGPDPVEVAGGVDRAHVGQDAPAALLALAANSRSFRSRACRAAGVVGTGSTGGRGGWRGGGSGARHRAAALDPPRVERHDVEAVEHVGSEDRQFVGQVVDARSARAARIDDDGPDPLGRDLGRVPGHGDLRVGPRSVVVVERDGHRAALEVTARRPLHGGDRQGRWCGRRGLRRGRVEPGAGHRSARRRRGAAGATAGEEQGQGDRGGQLTGDSRRPGIGRHTGWARCQSAPGAMGPAPAVQPGSVSPTATAASIWARATSSCSAIASSSAMTSSRSVDS